MGDLIESLMTFLGFRRSIRTIFLFFVFYFSSLNETTFERETQNRSKQAGNTTRELELSD